MIEDAHEDRDQAWLRNSQPFARAIEEYYAERGRTPDDAAVRSTIRTNTELVPKRAAHLVKVLEEAGVGLEGRSVLELGPGFGALASYLAWVGRPERYLGIEIREDFVATATKAARALALDDRLAFSTGSMMDLGEVPTASVDVVIANNALLYAAERADVKAVIAETRRVLAPDGALLIHQANRLRWSEPFTNDPLVHLLPPRVAGGVAKLTGWRHNHGRVRLMSPGQMRRALRRAGFRDITLVVPAKHARVPVLRHSSGFFSILGRVRES